MTIDEARQRTTILEQLISDEIRSYESATGLKVDSVHVDRMRIYVGEPDIIKVSADVRMVS